ncbi:MAG: hypothetical protein HFI71_15320 [Lachnospiraceae bacterium]|jgi:hypothetical protein|nr:hypothetical protein [Lachnospiraceae bacterium]
MANNNRRRKSGGWAKTKKYPHERHPANYVRKVGDKIEYLTFTHAPEVKLPNGAVIQTVPMADNVSKKEREENARKGLKRGENRSYAYPVVFEGKRSALHKEIANEFEPIPFDKARIETMFKIFPRVNVKFTGNGKGNKKAPK